MYLWLQYLSILLALHVIAFSSLKCFLYLSIVTFLSLSWPGLLAFGMVFQFLSFLHPLLFCLLFRPCLLFLSLSSYVFICLSFCFFVSVCRSCLSFFSCLFIFVFYIFSSAFCLCAPLSIVLLFYDWFCFVWLQNNSTTVQYSVYTYLLPGHLVGTEDDAVPASPFYIVIRTSAQ
jgi:hypothetical protein